MKTSIFSFTLTALLFTLIFSSGCGKTSLDADPGTFTPASSTVSMTATIDGTSWTAEEIQSSSQNYGQGWQYIIQGKGPDGYSLNFTMQTFNNVTIGAGTYDLGASTTMVQSVIYVSPANTYIIRPDTVPAGQLVIDQLTGNQTSGTFSVKLVHDILNQSEVPIQVTGSFKTDNYRNFN
ncbi:MAG: hypothetical protein H6581_24755 [Bacteroidia bacterium]|nr:hypothetical protein [Bacteroidia bacterium]